MRFIYILLHILFLNYEVVEMAFTIDSQLMFLINIVI